MSSLTFADQVARNVHRTVADETALSQIPPRALSNGALCAVDADGKIRRWRPLSTRPAAVGYCVVPTVIAASAAFIASQASAPGRWETAESTVQDWKDSVRVVTAAPLPAYTRVGNVLTMNANGSLNVGGIDGVTNLVVGNRVGVKDGAAGPDNGLFNIAILGTPGTAAVLTRTPDADTSSKVTPGMSFEVEEGTVNAGKLFELVTPAPIVLNTTALTFQVQAGEAEVPVKRTVHVVFGGLAAGSTSGAPVSVNLGTTLPANARIMGVALKLATPFTGGGATTATLDVGTSADPVSHVAGADVLHAAVDGQAFTMPPGKAPNKQYVTAGAQLLARFTPDAGHTLLGLTAGAIDIDVIYFVLP